MTTLLFGCGYLGARVAARWHDAHDAHVIVVTRSPQRAAVFRQQGYETLVADVTRPESLAALPAADTVVFAVGYDRTARQSIEQVYAGGLGNVLAALPRGTGRLIYISTTGVYGNAQGGWVDEATPPDPQREGGRASLAAEQALAAHPLGARSIVLRLAGIYGPGRLPFLDQLRSGQPIAAATEGHLNLIHVEDAASVILAAADAAPFDDGPRVYCVSDGCPVQRGEFYREAARQIGAALPRFIDPEPHSPRAARASSDRRVRNDRMRAELGVRLEYPDYRAGLEALVETENQ